MKIIHELEGIAFGLTDGIICFLGLLIGVAASTNNPTFVIIAGVIAGVSNAFGNSLGVFISQSTERGIQIHEKRRHKINTRIHPSKEVFLISVYSFLATISSLVILLLPFFIFRLTIATMSSFLFGLILLFVLGFYNGKLSEENAFFVGFKYVILGIMVVVVCYTIGNYLRFYSFRI